MIEVRRLRLLHALATYGTVTAAARALHLTGPAVSQQLGSAAWRGRSRRRPRL